MPSGPGAIDAPLASAVALSVFGMAFHTIREFGLEGMWSVGSGFLPVTAVQATLVLLGWRVSSARRGAVKALLVTGLFQLLGGGILSVLPLPFLPFAPVQTLDHYISHAVLGVAQIPLIVIALRALAKHTS